MDCISVIIPVYNIDEWIPYCLESVCTQTYQKLEIIIVNDGSTDATDAICRQYLSKDKRIVYLVQENKGLSAARNLGMRNATGKYIVFVDGDDWISCNMVEELYHSCIEYDCDISLCNYENVSEESNANHEENCCDSKRLPPSKMLARDVLLDMYSKKSRIHVKSSVWAKMYLRELISDMRFPEGRYYEDNLYTTKAIYHSRRCAWTDRGTYYYRTGRTGSIIWQDNLDRLVNDEIELMKQRIDFLAEHGEYELAGYARKQMLNRMIAYYGRMLLQPGKYKERIRLFRNDINTLGFPHELDMITIEIMLFRLCPDFTGVLLKQCYQIICKMRKADYAKNGYNKVKIREDQY